MEKIMKLTLLLILGYICLCVSGCSGEPYQTSARDRDYGGSYEYGHLVLP
jgi:hypothetical protein